MTLRSIIGLGGLALIAAGLTLPRLVSGQREAAEPQPAAEIPPALEVEVLHLQPRPLTEKLATTGTLRANEQVNLVSEIAGVVRKIHFQEGSPVEQGDLLVKIDDAVLQAQRERVEHRMRLAEIREERQSDLREQGVTSEQDFDIAYHELQALRAEIRLVDAQIGKTEVRAPFSGIIGLRFISDGSLLSPQTRIATLQDLDPIKIDFTLPEKYAGTITPGSRIDFRIKGSGRRHTAEVFAVEPRIDPETRSLRIRARTANQDLIFLPGAFADVSVAVGKVVDALVVPSLAIVPELGGKKVFVIENDLAQPRRVETGIRTDTEVQITKGLDPGARVIVSAIQRLRPGLPVEPIPPGANHRGTAP